MLEKSPFDLLDFLKQRRRWFHGLWLTALKRDLKLRTRLRRHTHTHEQPHHGPMHLVSVCVCVRWGVVSQCC